MPSDTSAAKFHEGLRETASYVALGLGQSQFFADKQYSSFSDLRASILTWIKANDDGRLKFVLFETHSRPASRSTCTSDRTEGDPIRTYYSTYIVQQPTLLRKERYQQARRILFEEGLQTLPRLPLPTRVVPSTLSTSPPLPT